MSKPIILCADSTCDIGPELAEKYQVHLMPFHIILDDKPYLDRVDLTPEDIVNTYNEKHILPKTAAINVEEYIAFFKPFVDDGAEVIHLTLGSGLSSTCQNSMLAAEELGNVYVVDTCSLSTGSGLLVDKAGKMIAEGKLEAAEIAEQLRALVPKVHASFILDTLEFLHKGGRCSALAMFGANLLKIKPSIRVSTADGTMSVGKKYRGTFEKVLAEYIKDELDGVKGLDPDTIFVTHSPISKERAELAAKELQKYQKFEHIYDTDASCTITSHCGPNCIGVLYLEK